MRVTKGDGLLSLCVCCGYVLSVLTFVLSLKFSASWFNSVILQNISLVIPYLPQKEKRKVFHWVSNVNQLRKDSNMC